MTRYARGVADGSIVAGPLVRKAGERHLLDLEEGPERGLVWDWEAGKRVVDYFETVLKLNGGDHEGKPFILHESQVFIVGSIFGWKTSDGYRRFRVAYIEEGKGNGKSPLGAGIGLYMLTADGEPRAEVYAAAVDREQARIIFRDAVAMVEQSELLDEVITRSGGRGREYNLAYLKTGSFFRPISSEHSGGRGKSGPRPHCVILDEVHEHPTPMMVEFMRANTKGRNQALVLMITNSGFDRESVCFHYHEYARRILEGLEQSDAFFGYVCGLDEGDDWKDPKAWPKANPLLGVSISEKYLREQVREAVGMPSKQSLVRRLNTCEWVGSEETWIPPELWRACGGSIPDDELEGRECFGGLDLSGKNDLSSLELVFPLDDGRKAVKSYFWTPAETLRERSDRDHVDYVGWARDGVLIATPGRVVGYDFMALKLGELLSRFRILAVGFDRWRVDDLARELDKIGVDIPLVEHGQGFKDMNPAVEAVEDDVLNGNLLHGGHPVLAWCVDNARVVSDAAGNRKLDKKKSTGRIDGAVALSMACNLPTFWANPKIVHETSPVRWL